MLKILLCGKKNSKVIKSNDVGKQNTNGMAHSRWVCDMKLPLHWVSSQFPFACKPFPFLIVGHAFTGIAWKHKDICWLLGSKPAELLAELSGPKISGGAASGPSWGHDTHFYTIGQKELSVTTLLPHNSIVGASIKWSTKVPALKTAFCGLQSGPVKPQAEEVGFHVAHAGVNHVLLPSRCVLLALYNVSASGRRFLFVH